MSEFLVQVRERSIEAVHNADIKALYDLVETHNEELNDDIEQGLYGNILELALELLTNALETKSKLSLEDEQQRYTLRALYEYSISHYSSNRFSDAKALFEVLEGTAQEEGFVESMKIHAAAAGSEIDIDTFIDKYCVVNGKMDDFYIKEFTDKGRKLLKKA
jgi:purine nucleoside permease